MKCPYCGYSESKVIDSRPADENSSIRRRRECLSCGKRFTTYETVESLPMVVVKKDGSRQSFDRRKVLGGMIRACEKRPVPLAELEKIAEEIEQDLQNSMEREISTEAIGEKVMERLRNVDQVAYVRFASVYRQFKDIDTFMTELNKLLADNRCRPSEDVLDIQPLRLRQEPELIPQVRDLRPELRQLPGGGEGQGPAVHGLRVIHRIMPRHDVEVGLAFRPVVIAACQRIHGLGPGL